MEIIVKIETLTNYMTDENTYLIYNNGSAVVVDPGNSADEIIKTAEKLGVKIEYVFITHCHYDHIEFLEELREKTGALLVSGDNASVNIGKPEINHSYSGLGYNISAKKSDIILSDGEEFSVDGIKIKCIYTPGHTNCGVCYLAENHIFVGDTLFLRSIGRSDLPTGDQKTLEKSIKEKIYTLDENIIIHSGHGNDTNIGYEKKFNFFV